MPNEVFAAVKAHPSIMLLGPLAERTGGVSVLATLPPPTLPIEAHAADPLGLVKRFLATYEGRVLFVAESKGRRETLSELFRQHAIPFVLFADFPDFLTGDARIGLTVAPLQRGVRIEDRHIAIVCESGRRHRTASAGVSVHSKDTNIGSTVAQTSPTSKRLSCGSWTRNSPSLS